VDKALKVIKLIEKQVSELKIPWVTEESKKDDPYRVLISCILSLRTKDVTTAQASQRLFKVADNPRKIFEDFDNKVPDNLEDLLNLKGVGRKTANLVLGLGYGLASICVDTHVHRISNRLGWVKTKNPHQTEEALRKIITRRYWIRLNTLLVAFGQNVCLPISPYCSRCSVRNLCKRIGVIRWR
jgi:endonuclease-3